MLAVTSLTASFYKLTSDPMSDVNQIITGAGDHPGDPFVVTDQFEDQQLSPLNDADNTLMEVDAEGAGVPEKHVDLLPTEGVAQEPGTDNPAPAPIVVPIHVSDEPESMEVNLKNQMPPPASPAKPPSRIIPVRYSENPDPAYDDRDIVFCPHLLQPGRPVNLHRGVRNAIINRLGINHLKMVPDVWLTTYEGLHVGCYIMMELRIAVWGAEWDFCRGVYPNSLQPLPTREDSHLQVQERCVGYTGINVMATAIYRQPVESPWSTADQYLRAGQRGMGAEETYAFSDTEIRYQIENNSECSCRGEAVQYLLEEEKRSATERLNLAAEREHVERVKVLNRIKAEQLQKEKRASTGNKKSGRRSSSQSLNPARNRKGSSRSLGGVVAGSVVGPFRIPIMDLG